MFAPGLLTDDFFRPGSLPDDFYNRASRGLLVDEFETDIMKIWEETRAGNQCDEVADEEGVELLQNCRPLRIRIVQSRKRRRLWY